MSSKLMSLAFAFLASSRRAFDALHNSVRFAPARAVLGALVGVAFYAFASLAPGDNFGRLLVGDIAVVAPWRHGPAVIAAVLLWRLIARWMDPLPKRPRLGS